MQETGELTAAGDRKAVPAESNGGATSPASTISVGSDRLDAAIARLTSAVDLVESAAERVRETSMSAGAIETEMHRLADDRNHLAQSLDSAKARAAELEAANRDVSRRIVVAMERIRGLLPAERE